MKVSFFLLKLNANFVAASSFSKVCCDIFEGKSCLLRQLNLLRWEYTYLIFVSIRRHRKSVLVFEDTGIQEGILVLEYAGTKYILYLVH